MASDLVHPCRDREDQTTCCKIYRYVYNIHAVRHLPKAGIAGFESLPHRQFSPVPKPLLREVLHWFRKSAQITPELIAYPAEGVQSSVLTAFDGSRIVKGMVECARGARKDRTDFARVVADRA